MRSHAFRCDETSRRKSFDPVMQLLHLPPRLFALPFERLQALDLLLDLLQFLLRFESRIHLDYVSIPAAVMRFHNREQETPSREWRDFPALLLGLVRSGYFRSIQ